MIKWLFYSVPEQLKFIYVLLLLLNMFIIPEYVLQIRLNIEGEFLNFLTFDLLFYIFSKNVDFNKEE